MGKTKSGGTSAPKKDAKGAKNEPSVGKKQGFQEGVGKGHAAPKTEKKGSTAHEGETYNPGVKSPTIDPFMNAEDIMNYSTARNEYLAHLNELDYSYGQAVTQSSFEKDQIAKQQGVDLQNTGEDAAARGLQRSSVRDTELFDIDATAAMKQQFLDTNMNTMKLHTEAEKARLNDYWNNPETGFMHGMQMKEVNNAQAASGETPEYTTKPGWEATKPATGAGGGKNPNAPKQGATIVAPHPSPTGTGGTPAPKKDAPKNRANVAAAKAIMGKNYGT